MSHQLFTYGKPNFKNDATVLEIISPSKKEVNGRINAKYPLIKIQNTGSNTLYSINLEYGIKGKKISEFLWVGKLEFLNVSDIILPEFDWSEVVNDDIFHTKIINVNGSKDDYEENDILYSNIEPLIVIPNKFIIHIETNDQDRAKENAYTVTDQSGKVFYERDNFKDDTTYDDVIELDKGMYGFRLTDRYQDGMIRQWWYYSTDKEKVGKNGRVAIMDSNKNIIKELKFDFADELNFQFIVR